MGSFNTSCFLSRQTIAPGDPCMLVPIRQQRTYQKVGMTVRDEKVSVYGPFNSVCYPTRFWAPIGSFFEAKYDDCGESELLDTKSNRISLYLLISEALRLTPTTHQGENEYHDLPFDLKGFMQEKTPELFEFLNTERGTTQTLETSDAKPTFDLRSAECFKQMVDVWDYMFDVAQKGRLFWMRGDAPTPVGFAVMHGAAYDELLKMTERGEFTSWNGDSLAPLACVQRAVAKAVSMKTSRCESLGIDVTADAVEGMDAMQVYEFYSALDDLRELSNYEGSSFSYDLQPMRGALASYLTGKADAEQLTALLLPWAKVRAANLSILAMNLHYEPMVYTSQDYSNDIGELYVKFIDTVSKKASELRNDE